MATHKIAVIGGDGIGPEVIGEARRLLEYLQRERGLSLELWELPLSAEYYLREGVGFPRDLKDEVERSCRAVLLGAVGDARVPGGEHAHEILMGMRQGWDLYVNLRPVRALSDALVPLKGKRASDIDFLIYRENTEGQYLGGLRETGEGDDECAVSEELHSRRGVERLLRAALLEARARKLPLVMTDKANAIWAQRLWRRVLAELGREFPDVSVRAVYLDALAAELVLSPERSRVIAANNLFGDVLGDLCSALAGGLGLSPSANLHAADPLRVALFEPVHGSAPDIAGKGIANPLGALRSVGMMVSHLGFPAEAERIERACAEALRRGLCTPDLGGRLGTRAAASAVLDVLAHD